MKNGILQFASTLLIVTFMIAVFPTEEDYRVYEDTLRLHILPNSDSRVDQDLKIGVRDLILDRLGGRLEGADAISSAMMITEGMLDEIQEMADGFLAESGVDYPWQRRRAKLVVYSLPSLVHQSCLRFIGRRK